MPSRIAGPGHRISSNPFPLLALASALVLGTATPSTSATTWLPSGPELIDRKFPSSWCPYELVSFTALDTEAVLVFEAENLDPFASPYHHRLDNLMVISRAAWDAFAAVPVWLNGSCNCFGDDPQETFFYDQFLASPGADPAQIVYFELFDVDPTTAPDTPWVLGSGATFVAPANESAPGSPYDFADIDPTSGSLALDLGEGVDATVTASVRIEGMVPDTEYVVAGWWSVVFGGSCTEVDAPLTVDVVGEDPTSVPGSSFPTSANVRIESAWPNPFTERTTLGLRVPAGESGSLQVYDVAGRLVRTFDLRAIDTDARIVVWDGRDAEGRAVASGTYHLRLTTPSERHRARLVLVR